MLSTQLNQVKCAVGTRERLAISKQSANLHMLTALGNDEGGGALICVIKGKDTLTDSSM